MRRGGMRGWLALGVGLAVALTTVGCQRDIQAPSLGASETPSVSPDSSPPASPTPTPVDPAATVEVCGLATAATQTTTTIFNEQIAAIEEAAARNDQGAMVTAAEAINQQFVSLGNTFTQLVKRRISPELRVVLTDIATALEQMSSLSYTGTTVDIRKKLLDFTSAIDAACGRPDRTSPSPAG